MERGVAEEDFNKFFKPTIENLEAPENLIFVRSAAGIILDAVRAKKKFGLVIDSDVDGICSATIIYRYLHELDPDVSITYFFHSSKQHGLEDTYENFIEAGVDLVLEPDAGINDYPYHKILNANGIGTVVMDHHEFEGNDITERSDCAIYVDNQISPAYKNKSLAGCGVTWQVCRYIDQLAGTNFAFKYIDLVALGCAADVMSPLTLENRFIFDYGFSHIQYPTFTGLCEKQAYSMKNKVNYTSVAFYIAPLINSCMRVGTPDEKLLMYKMFLHPERTVESQKRGAKGENVSIIEEGARVLTNVKARQQKLLDKYTSIFEGRIEEYGLADNNLIAIHLTDEDQFDSELNGLIAMKISDKYHKPCIVVRDGIDNLTKGSMRNPNGSPIENLKDLIGSSPYTNFVAGHASAAGLGIETPHFEDFINWFNRKTTDLKFNENCYEINFDVTPNDDYIAEMCMDLGGGEPYWGGNNPQPLIYVHNIYLKSNEIAIQGKNKDSIKFTCNGVACVMFKATDVIEKIKASGNDLKIDLVGKANLNEWMGHVSPQIIIDDIEVEENNLFTF